MKAHFPKHKKQMVKPGHQSPAPVQKQMAVSQTMATKSPADILYPPTNPPANVMGQ